MFSGIVETMGEITNIIKTPEFWTINIKAPAVLNDCNIGDSIAVNGICLTVISFNHDSFIINAVPETLRKTNLGSLSVNDYVNLERAIKLNSRIGGHLIQGHVDTTCEFIGFETVHNGVMANFTIPQGYQQYLIDKGYIAIDGMSLTIARLEQDYFSIAFIPHTIDMTIVQHYQPKQKINIEVDMVGKYLQRFIQFREMTNA